MKIQYFKIEKKRAKKKINIQLNKLYGRILLC